MNWQKQQEEWNAEDWLGCSIGFRLPRNNWSSSPNLVKKLLNHNKEEGKAVSQKISPGFFC